MNALYLSLYLHQVAGVNLVEVLVLLLGRQVVLSRTTLSEKCPAPRLSGISSRIDFRRANLFRKLILHFLCDRKVLFLAFQERGDGRVVCTNDFAGMLLLLLESVGRNHCSGRGLLFLLLFRQRVIRAEDHSTTHIVIIICAEYVAFALLRRLLCFLLYIGCR